MHAVTRLTAPSSPQYHVFPGPRPMCGMKPRVRGAHASNLPSAPAPDHVLKPSVAPTQGVSCRGATRGSQMTRTASCSASKGTQLPYPSLACWNPPLLSLPLSPSLALQVRVPCMHLRRTCRWRGEPCAMPQAKLRRPSTEWLCPAAPRPREHCHHRGRAHPHPQPHR